MTAAVDIESVDLSLGGKLVLSDLSLALGPGESLAVVGPNGSGKTSMLRLLATLVKPSSGTGTILDRQILSPSIREIRGRIGLISHTPALIGELTIAENLDHFARLAVQNPDDCTRALHVVGLEQVADRRVNESSFGMQRRTEIAWLLVAKPDLLLLDEAKSGLDVDARELVDAMIDLTLSRSGTVIAVSHDISQLGSALHRQMHLISGRLEPLS